MKRTTMTVTYPSPLCNEITVVRAGGKYYETSTGPDDLEFPTILAMTDFDQAQGHDETKTGFARTELTEWYPTKKFMFGEEIRSGEIVRAPPVTHLNEISGYDHWSAVWDCLVDMVKLMAKLAIGFWVLCFASSSPGR